MEKAKKRLINFSLVASDKYNLNESQLNIIDKVFISIYLFLSCFETFLPSFLGSSTKYVMLLICFLLLIKDIFRRNIVIKWHVIFMLLWLGLKVLSIFWGGYNGIVDLHFLSQFGFVLLFICLGVRKYSADDQKFFIFSLLATTFLFSLMSILFQAPYHSVYVSRRVLTLFGKQLDPNNCAAFQTICFSISIYLVLFKRKYLFIISFVVSAVACLLSGSRAGLLAMVIILVVSVMLFPLETKYSILIKMASLITLAVLSLLLCLIFLPAETFTRLFLEGYINSGGGERNVYWKLAFDMFANKPILGSGWGTASYFGKAQSEAVHNTFLSMLAENGLVGLILFVSFPIWFLINGIKKKNYFIVLMFISFFVPAFFIDSINKRFIWNILYLFLIVSISNPYFKYKSKKVISDEKNQYYRISI